MIAYRTIGIYRQSLLSITDIAYRSTKPLQDYRALRCHGYVFTRLRISRLS